MQGPPSVRRPAGMTASSAAAAAAAAAVAATRSTSPFTRPGRISGPTRIPSMTRLQSRAVAPFAGQRELKYLDTELTGMPFGTSGAGRVVCLNALAEGADKVQTSPLHPAPVTSFGIRLSRSISTFQLVPVRYTPLLLPA